MINRKWRAVEEARSRAGNEEVTGDEEDEEEEENEEEVVRSAESEVEEANCGAYDIWFFPFSSSTTDHADWHASFYFCSWFFMLGCLYVLFLFTYCFCLFF